MKPGPGLCRDLADALASAAPLEPLATVPLRWPREPLLVRETPNSVRRLTAVPFSLAGDRCHIYLDVGFGDGAGDAAVGRRSTVWSLGSRSSITKVGRGSIAIHSATPEL